MQRYSLLKKAIFLKRINRFVLMCEDLNGGDFYAHLPNPGRLWELLIPGKIVYISPAKGQLPYTVWAVEKNGNPVLLHTHYTNIVAEKILKDRLITELHKYNIKNKEVWLYSHRIDFLLENKRNCQIFLEVKSCTLFYGSIGMFPDAPTSRGRAHIEAMAKVRGSVLFIVHSPDVRFFLPDFHTDPEFAETLYRFKERILIKAVSVKWDEDLNFSFLRELEIPWNIYEQEASNKGSYFILGRLSKDRCLVVGSLGKIMFKSGYYIYTGSALNSLHSRIARHMRKRKTQTWHIDYLIPYLESVKPIPVRSSEDIECRIAQEMSTISDDIIRSFGSSDCGCIGHLFYMQEDPLTKEAFVNLLMRFRLGRLEKFLNPF